MTQLLHPVVQRCGEAMHAGCACATEEILRQHIGSPTGKSAPPATEPTVMRSHVFSSTMEICHRLLQSRDFRVTEGGLRVTANAAYEQRGTPECSDRNYHVTLVQNGLILDDEYGTCDFPQGRPFSRQWTNLPQDEYHLTIWTNNTNPYCCLVGDIVVEQSAELSGESCTQAPPGPLEILHTALDVAGLIPVLGAVPDAINAGIYIVEGDWVGAGFSAAAMIPLFGDAATVGKLGTKTVLRVTGEGVERIGREGVEAGVRRIRNQPRIDPDVDAAVERGIVEEATGTTRPTRRPRPTPPAVRGTAEAARRTFEGLRDQYARRLGVRSGGQVHHAIELQVLDRYPGVFAAQELNDFANMRGIATELANRRQLHNSKIREFWDRHYRSLDEEIAHRGLQPGEVDYDSLVRNYLTSGREEIDHLLSQFFTEYRSSFDWTAIP